MNENQTPVIWTVIGVAALLLIAGLFMTASINSNLTSLASGFEMPTAEAIGAVVLAGITMPEMPEFPDYVITQEDYEENLMEGEAERLVLLEIYS